MPKRLFIVKMEEVELGVLAAKEVVRDVHMETAVRIFGCTPNQVTPNMRRQAKAVNFLTIYGGGRIL